MGTMILRRPEQFYIVWCSNAGWIINFYGKLIGIDLDFFHAERIIPIDETILATAANLDYYFVTHEHEDHFNSETCSWFSENSNCQFVIPASCIEKAYALVRHTDRVTNVFPRQTYDMDGIEVQTTRAVHGHLLGSVCARATMLDCGYRITYHGKTLYHPGDTLLLEDHFNMAPVDVLFVSPTEHNTGIEHTIKLIELLQPKEIFPQHYGTYLSTPENAFWTKGYVDEVYERLPKTMQARFHRLLHFEKYEIRE